MPVGLENKENHMKHRAIFHSLVATTMLMSTVGISVAQTVFVPEGSANSVSVVDFKSKSIIQRFQDLEAVHGMAVAREKQLFIAGSIAEINDEAAKISKPANMSAEDHAAHHPSSSMASDSESKASKSLLTVVNFATGDVIRKIEVPGAVHHVAVTPDERFAIATHMLGNGISIVNLSSLQLEAFIPTGNNPNYLAFGEDPDLVYVSNAGNGTVSEVDLQRRIVRRNIIAGSSPEHMITDLSSGMLYVADANEGQVLELNLGTGELRRTFYVGGEIHGLAQTPDKQRLIATVTDEDRLSSINLLSNEIVSKPLSPAPYHLTVVQGTQSVFVSSRADSIVWSVNLSDLSVSEEIAIKGEGHQMISLP